MTNRDSGEVARFLEWDSAFFGKRIARAQRDTLTPDDVEQINSWAAQNRIDCIYFLATINDDQTILCAEKDGYHLVDLRVTLAIDLTRYRTTPAQNPSVRLSRVSDISDLRKIAGVNHTISRFFTDRHFDREKCRQLYEVWIEKSVKGRADRVFVWDDQNKAVAYVTAVIDPDQRGSIELVGVAPEWQGRGVGKILISTALGYFAEQRIFSVTTVTQGRNIPAMNFYQKCGFSIQSIELWYHKWFKEQ